MSEAFGRRSIVQSHLSRGAPHTVAGSTPPRTSDLAISVRRATSADAPALAELVNRAYAIEAFFVEGDRTHPHEIVAMLERGLFVVLEHSCGLAAAVYVELSGYFGMLSVLPEFQGHGLGKRLVRIAEALC